MDFASRYERMSVAQCLGRKRKEDNWNIRVDDPLTDANFSVPPGVDVSWYYKFTKLDFKIFSK